MRFASEVLCKLQKTFALRIDLRQMTPAVGAGVVTICASSHGLRKKKRKAERRKTLIRIRRNLSAAARALQGALAFRRSTTALARGTVHPNGSVPGQAWCGRCHVAVSRRRPSALPATHLARRS
jgi:hypothetical protein